LARKLCFLDGPKKNVSTRLLSFRYGFDFGWQPAFSSASCGSRGEPRFYARWRFFHAEPPGKAVASVAQALAVPAPALAEAFRVPDDNAAADGKHPSVAAASQLEKYKSVHRTYRTASHGAACLVFLVGGADLAADGVPFRVAEF